MTRALAFGAPALAIGMVAGVLIAPAARAQSDTCVLLPSPSTQAPEAVREQVQVIVAEELREHGNVVLSPRDAQMRMVGQPMRDCAQIDCAASVNRQLGTGFAVLTEIAWVGGRVTMINVALIGLEDGESVGGQAEVVGGDVAAAVRAAFQAAWDRWAASQQGYVIVSTTPPGAFIELDGASLGRAPIRRLTRAGVHSLRATLEGHRSVSREITIDRHEEREIEITLTEGDGEETPAEPQAVDGHPPPREGVDQVQQHWSNWAIGGALIATGIAALITPIWTLAEEGSAVPREGRPDDYVQFGPLSGALLGLGTAAIAGGAVMMIVQPIRTTVRVTPTGAGVTVSGRF
jgi:hypothetical protein